MRQRSFPDLGAGGRWFESSRPDINSLWRGTLSERSESKGRPDHHQRRANLGPNDTTKTDAPPASSTARRDDARLPWWPDRSSLWMPARSQSVLVRPLDPDETLEINHVARAQVFLVAPDAFRKREQALIGRPIRTRCVVERKAVRGGGRARGARLPVRDKDSRTASGTTSDGCGAAQRAALFGRIPTHRCPSFRPRRSRIRHRRSRTCCRLAERAAVSAAQGLRGDTLGRRGSWPQTRRSRQEGASSNFSHGPSGDVSASEASRRGSILSG